MNLQELAGEINKALEDWSKNKDKLVVAIDGYTGVGKTTIIKELEKINFDIVIVHRDDLLLDRQTIENLLSNTEDKSLVWELRVTDNEKIEKLIQAFKNGEKIFETYIRDEVTGKIDKLKKYDLDKKIMIIEGVFMFHPELPIDKLFDKRIYLEGDQEKIDERRIKREKARWGDEYFPETHPDSYLRHIIIALKRYFSTHKPHTIADLVLKVDFK